MNKLILLMCTLFFAAACKADFENTNEAQDVMVIAMYVPSVSHDATYIVVKSDGTMCITQGFSVATRIPNDSFISKIRESKTIQLQEEEYEDLLVLADAVEEKCALDYDVIVYGTTDYEVKFLYNDIVYRMHNWYFEQEARDLVDEVIRLASIHFLYGGP